MQISDIACLPFSSLTDFPFEHELTENSISILRNDTYNAITGFCSGSVINNSSPRLFFRVGHDSLTGRYVEHEYRILSQLQIYDFVPRIVCLKTMGRYTVLFTEVLDAVSLDTLPRNDTRLHHGYHEGLRLAHKLYSEIGFVHGDLYPGNIMISPGKSNTRKSCALLESKVYLIDFTTSIISTTQRLSWVKDLSIFVCSINGTQALIDMLEVFDEKLGRLKESYDPDLYLKYINDLEHILFE